MLPSLGFQEIILLGVLALIVVGPKDLPLLLRKLGRWTAKLRGMAQEFRTGFDELARQAELDELKKEVDALRRTSSLNSVVQEVQRPLGTLESYAGISPPPPPAPPEAVEGVEANEPVADAPSGAAATPEPAPIEDMPTPADAKPVVRSVS
ncbi:Sec-independent protein translocase protein TatB [Terricaulis sp.]|uniref:Sec-independent protein translocase protein TatB n=1 Tax=Terricaulis sp. TaxID=2768686 RepID=UPI0037835B55